MDVEGIKFADNDDVHKYSLFSANEIIERIQMNVSFANYCTWYEPLAFIELLHFLYRYAIEFLDGLFRI